MLLLDDYIARNPDSIVHISHGGSGVGLSGIISDPQLTQSLSAMYQDGMKSSISQLAQSASNSQNKFARGLGGAASMFSSYATSKNTLLGSVKLYDGSGDPNMQFNVTLFCNLQGNPGFKAIDNQLNLLTQPKVLAGGLLGSNLYAPSDLLALTTNPSALDGKLIYVSVGQWLMVQDVYITNLSKMQSTIMDETESPLFLNISFQIMPYKQLTAEQLSAWILK